MGQVPFSFDNACASLSGFNAHPHLKHEPQGEGWLSLLCPCSSEHSVYRLWALGSCSETWVNARQHEKAGQRRGPCQTRSTEQTCLCSGRHVPEAHLLGPRELSSSLRPCEQGAWTPFWELERPGTEFPHNELVLGCRSLLQRSGLLWQDRHSAMPS